MKIFPFNKIKKFRWVIKFDTFCYKSCSNRLDLLILSISSTIRVIIDKKKIEENLKSQSEHFLELYQKVVKDKKSLGKFLPKN